MNRPSRVLGVLGTGTDIGKTWVTAGAAGRLVRDGHRVSVRKPVQSFDPTDGHPLDAEVLAAATGERVEDVCAPRHSIPVPMAPPMAAEVSGMQPPSIADLIGCLAWPADHDLGFVEGVGGVRSPVAADGDNLALLSAIGVDGVVLIADASLGTIDRVRCAVDVLGGRWPLRVHLNRYDATDRLHRMNHEWLVTQDELRVTVGLDELVDALGADHQP